MASNLSMNIDEVLKQSSNQKTYTAADQKEKSIGGRPRIDESEKLTKQISLYLNESEFDFLIEYAKRNYMNKNSVVRMLIKKAMDE